MNEYSYWFCVGRGYKNTDPERPSNFAVVVEVNNTDMKGNIQTPNKMFTECINRIKEQFDMHKVLITTFDRKQ